MFKKYRKITLVLTALLMILMAAGLPKNEALAGTTHSVSEIMDLTGILRDDNGSTLIKGHYASRAEFAQMLIRASEYAGKVSSSNSLQLFTDVPKKSTYASYIQLAVTNSYMSGYLNGKFKPNKAVTAKEAVYGILTLLGYTSEDFSGQMADARFNKFSELGLDKNLKLSAKSKLTKAECQTLFYNLLQAKQKSGDLYGKTLGYTFDSNNRIDYQTLFTAKTKGPVITKSGWSKVLSRKLSTYIIIRDNKKIKASQIKAGSIAYYAEQANTIWIFNTKINGIIQNITYTQGEPQDITIAGNTYVIDNTANMKDLLTQNHIKKGSRVILYLGRNDLASHLVPVLSTLANSGWEKRLSFSPIKGTIYINNKKAKVTDIATEDVIYYANELKTIWVFNKRVFGALNDYSLNETDADAVNVSGTSYLIEDSKKIKEHIQAASLQSKMPVVLLLGWNNKVYDILGLSSAVANDDWESKLSFNPSQGTVYKNSSVITKSDIKTNDVIYYSNELQTVWVYDKKVYGVLKTVTPSISSPESILVAGKTYTFDLPPVNSSAAAGDAGNLTSNAWGERLQKYGIKTGDNVIVLFGFNGYVADIIPVTKMEVSITGYVLSVEDQVVKNGTQVSTIQSIVTLVDIDGTVREYPCSDKNITAGMVVGVSFKDSQPEFRRYDTTTNYTIPSDIVTKKFTNDARILSVKNSYYATIPVYQMSDVNWITSNVAYYKYNTQGEITELILNQAYSSFYQYGILQSVDISDENGIPSMQFNFLFSDKAASLSGNNITTAMNPGPKAVLIADNKIQEMYDLTGVAISYISNMQANTGDNVYWIADDASIFFCKDGKYYAGSLEDITNFTDNKVTGFRSAQGPIRIIIVAER